ncbi:hypothetical protein EVAR_51988_1 [Eumeta japonica]|uniref:Uncharacterized protein n=1 Tax=Eumeta variegata TaxID=151549 RepID=A0A4C1Y398_EUMVA|nr:hypothetical protein EVAR_51988_1 [Eumeta japonica]
MAELVVDMQAAPPRAQLRQIDRPRRTGRHTKNIVFGIRCTRIPLMVTNHVAPCICVLIRRECDTDCKTRRRRKIRYEGETLATRITWPQLCTEITINGAAPSDTRGGPGPPAAKKIKPVERLRIRAENRQRCSRRRRFHTNACGGTAAAACFTLVARQSATANSQLGRALTRLIKPAPHAAWASARALKEKSLHAHVWKSIN